MMQRLYRIKWAVAHVNQLAHLMHRLVAIFYGIGQSEALRRGQLHVVEVGESVLKAAHARNAVLHRLALLI